MVQSLALVSPTSFSFSFSVHNSSSTAAFGTHRRVSYIGKNNKRLSICASAVTEAPPALKRTRPASLYEVLRVKRDASAKEIKAAYRNLAKLYHPDAASLPEESSDGLNFIEIHDAYATLSDPSSRALYDLKLSVGSRRRGFGHSSNGFRISRSEFYPTRRWETDQCW
ncbi:PREDICTED: chaperone protein dnaJ 11, chloroplastic-like [Nicotiana attenuata]|uniref:Chaperone protein dnaj 11, chloroplastic n=1 Tax=Nicotiana attenuata TaxID=49451 RepID=A0A1J6KFT9_NICAT|nr:PREDICTED: chaperone protein dnaJ 11, chloroplastic-like [Nicotiana attenuata]OIT27556.1 chaperone protein dnaj 11, chloroplastic [Nicotiana attenuata]